jgi:hypothetical protein
VLELLSERAQLMSTPPPPERACNVKLKSRCALDASPATVVDASAMALMSNEMVTVLPAMRWTVDRFQVWLLVAVPLPFTAPITAVSPTDRKAPGPPGVAVLISVLSRMPSARA